VEQFKRHITDDVLPPLLDELSTESSVAAKASNQPADSINHDTCGDNPTQN